ncbi:MAG: hypothetical protein M1815_004673 [Lichina confinis]|nr:MAG: hypothetical protein M1815_004673 [Lichina confinis]
MSTAKLVHSCDGDDGDDDDNTKNAVVLVPILAKKISVDARFRARIRIFPKGVQRSSTA